MDTNVVVAIGSNMVGSKQHESSNLNKNYTHLKLKDNQFSGASPEPLPKDIFGCPSFYADIVTHIRVALAFTR